MLHQHIDSYQNTEYDYANMKLELADGKLKIFQDVLTEINQLVAANRALCLWFLREDYFPSNAPEALKVLDHIQKHSDRKTYIKAGQLKKWLLQASKKTSAS